MSKQVDKGKKKVNKPSGSNFQVNKPVEGKLLAYKSAVLKTPDQLKAEIMATTPKEKKLREDAYKAAEETNESKEFLYPYVPLSTEWICPIEEKFSQLKPVEIQNFYLKDYANPFLHPKSFQYYYAILNYTKSVDFDSTSRGNEWAFSKAFIRRVITPDQWQGDFYSFREVSKEKRSVDRPWFNYFDYIKAWSGVFCYENRKMKHSWFLQFRDCDATNFPQWFIYWFSDWGLNPIILPDDVRTQFEEFCKVNKTMKHKELKFAALYRVPWILKWKIIVKNVPIRKFDVLQGHIPYMGRQILIKWWEKFEFFENSIFSSNGIFNLEPEETPSRSSPKRALSDLLGDLIQNSQGEELRDLKRYLKAKLFENTESDDDKTENISGDNLASQVGASSHHSDDIMQDAQSP